MARVKGRVPVTFSLAPDLLALIDGHAAASALDRYDVMRSALAQGITFMRMQHEVLKDPTGPFAQAVLSLAGGDDGEETRELLKDGLAQGYERDIPGGPSQLKRRRKVKDDGL